MWITVLYHALAFPSTTCPDEPGLSISLQSAIMMSLRIIRLRDLMPPLSYLVVDLPDHIAQCVLRQLRLIPAIPVQYYGL